MEGLDMKNKNLLRERVMRRVYFIFLLRKYLLNSFALKSYTSFVLFVLFLTKVSILSVIKNTNSLIKFDINALSYFYKYAFLHTELGVKIISVSILSLLAIVLAEKLAKVVSPLILKEKYY
jgi:hypothetical protein